MNSGLSAPSVPRSVSLNSDSNMRGCADQGGRCPSSGTHEDSEGRRGESGKVSMHQTREGVGGWRDEAPLCPRWRQCQVRPVSRQLRVQGGEGEK